MPKGEKAKPGKGAQTVAEAKWIEAILDRGCIACSVQYGCGINTPAEVHHILRGGRRLGHLFTIPLCHTHHRNGPTARHPYRKRFEREYGAELELLAMLKRELGVFDQASYR